MADESIRRECGSFFTFTANLVKYCIKPNLFRKKCEISHILVIDYIGTYAISPIV